MGQKADDCIERGGVVHRVMEECGMIARLFEGKRRWKLHTCLCIFRSMSDLVDGLASWFRRAKRIFWVSGFKCGQVRCHGSRECTATTVVRFSWQDDSRGMLLWSSKWMPGRHGPWQSMTSGNLQRMLLPRQEQKQRQYHSQPRKKCETIWP